MNKNLEILLVEDFIDLANSVIESLESSNHIVDYAKNGKQALYLLDKYPYDIIILDISLPDISGLTLLEKIRTEMHIDVPVLMLTARDTLSDKAIGFETGADDYITKPFSQIELELRCKAIWRRYSGQFQQKIELGPLAIDKKNKIVYRENKKIILHETSFLVLMALVDNYPKAVTKSYLYRKIWGDMQNPSDSLRSHLYKIRKLIDKPYEKKLIKTVHGVGFQIEV